MVAAKDQDSKIRRTGTPRSSASLSSSRSGSTAAPRCGPRWRRRPPPGWGLRTRGRGSGRWDALEAEGVARDPRPVHHHIPNFDGAATAAESLPRPQPRLRTGFFSVLECSMIPAGYIPEACTSVGAAKYGRPLGLDERIKVDLIVIGLVAVDPNSGAWQGKGEILHCLAKIYLDPSDPVSLTISTCGHQASVNTLGSTDTVTTSSNVIDEKSFSNPNKYILQVDNQSNSVRALQSAHRISDNQQAQRVPGAHCQPCPPHLLPLEKWNWWEVDWDSLGEERELLVFVRALKMFRGEVLSRVNAMASALEGEAEAEVVEAEQELIELQKHVSAQGNESV
ncbi:hypothetical protein EJB05_09005 [Eragrostis curvula]|uniref:Uncharacterized protein n=1 Tax=Eragrostis curvula TaxID=38414 RepID=A0A5J9W336_9POAL|nr:hypothetical protein EJB05_09005 [Eragrostis curvula]